MTLHTRLLGAAAAIALLLPVAAHADSGFYLGGNAGVGIAGDASFDDGTNTNSVETNPGFAFLFLGGYQFDSNWRAELEFGGRFNEVDSISGSGSTSPFDGNTRVFSVMADAIYGIPTGTRFTPYIGAGLGVAFYNANGIATTLGTEVDDNDTVLAYQGIAGVEYDLTSNLKAALDYRYFRTTEPQLTSVALSDVDAEYENHTITLGLRYLFPKARTVAAAEVPAAAPVATPPSAPMVPNNYIVFFDFDRANLTAEADRIVAAAAQNAQQAKVTTIEVTGHADRSGSARYNTRLSQRRADTIKAELINRGIAADQIAVTAKGESEPLVATADGVREAQNRRVQIVLK